MSKNSAQKKKQPKVVASAESVSQEPKAVSEASTSSSANVSRGGRIVSGVVGGGLLAYGLTHFLTIRGQVSNVAGIFMLTRGITGHCPIYQAMGIDSSPQGRMHHLGITDPHPIQFRQSFTTSRPPHEVFDFFRDQSQVARGFPQVKQMQKTDERHSTWVFSDVSDVVQFPVTVEITQEESTMIAWTAFPDSKLRITGSLQFKHGPHNQGTEVVATVHIIPPAGIMGATFLKWMSPIDNDTIHDVLAKMKQLIETGELTTSQDKVLASASESESGWPNRMKSRLQMRTLQSLASRRMT